MTSVEFNFLADQRGPRKMICENYVDRQWKKTAVRKRKQLESFRKREARAKEEVKRMEKVELTDEMVDEVFQTICNDDDDDDDDDEVDSVPKHLLCHVHPVLMFVRELDAAFKTIEGSIGRDKIFASFNVTPDTQESVMTQYLDCEVRLVCHDYDHKPWNRANEFDLFIAPKANTSIRMASERFTRYTFVCAVLTHHDQDIMSFLHKFENIDNNLACIVRSFESVEFLRVFSLVGALLGLHLIEPFTKMTSSCKTTYPDLQTAFPLLYDNFLNTNVDDFFQLNRPALSFTSLETFNAVKYSKPILESITSAIDAYRPQVSFP